MSFISVEFIIFFAVVLGLYHASPHRAQNGLLTLASYLFYGWWDWRFLSLILFSSTVDYVCGRLLDPEGGRALSPRARLAILWASVGTNLGLLATFKYYNFFIDSLKHLLGAELGLPWGLGSLEIILPVGISFYTFQTMSYTIDVYRGKMAATRRVDDFFLFVSFFPQLVAGPIERASRLLPQIEAPRRVRSEQVVSGAQLMLLGFAKKMIVADNLALLVDSIYSNPKADLTAWTVTLATYAFAFQIYADFSGYTDIARGAARMLGFDLCRNFKVPYLATNPSDFWQRWHVSLSSWLRDYLYISLGGNRHGAWRTWRNLMLTMLLGGLWHGASWNFVLWGAYHGLLLVIFHQFVPRRQAREAASAVRGGWRFWLAALGFFQLTCVGWFLFRVDSLSHIVTLGEAMGRVEWTAPLLSSLWTLVVFAAPLMALDIYRYKRDDPEPWRQWSLAGQVAFHLLLFYGVVLYGTPNAVSFIYFQF